MNNIDTTSANRPYHTDRRDFISILNLRTGGITSATDRMAAAAEFLNAVAKFPSTDGTSLSANEIATINHILSTCAAK